MHPKPQPGLNRFDEPHEFLWSLFDGFCGGFVLGAALTFVFFFLVGGLWDFLGGWINSGRFDGGVDRTFSSLSFRMNVRRAIACWLVVATCTAFAGMVGNAVLVRAFRASNPHRKKQLVDRAWLVAIL